MKRKLSQLDITAINEAMDLGYSVSEIWNYFREFKLGPSKTIGEAKSEFIHSKIVGGRSEQFIQDLNRKLREFAEQVGLDKQVSDLSLEDVSDWVLKLGTNSAPSRRSRMSNFLNFCRRRYYCKEVLTDRLEPIRRTLEEPLILSNQDMKKLILVVLQVDPGLLGYLWLTGALGIRQTEVMLLQKKDLRWEAGFVVISAKIAKCRSRRLVEMVENPFEQGGKRGVLSFQNNFRRRFDVVKKIANLSTWSRNCLRHTAATHLLNRFGDENKTALHLGNSPTMLHKHYKGIAVPKESEEYWKIWRNARQQR